MPGRLATLFACPSCHLAFQPISFGPDRAILDCPKCALGVPVLDGFSLFLERDVFDGTNPEAFLDPIARRCWTSLSDAEALEEEKRRRGLVDDYAAFQPFNESHRTLLSFVPLIRERLRPGDVILDLWNRTGWTGERLAGLFPQQTVVSVWEGPSGALGYAGFRRWLPRDRRAPNLEIAFLDPSEPLPFADGSIALVHGYDTLHRYKQSVLIPELFRVCHDNGALIFPHVHLANGTPNPFFEREGVHRHGDEYQRLLHRLSGPNRSVFVLGERTLIEKQGRSTPALLKTEPSTSDYNALVAVLPSDWAGRSIQPAMSEIAQEAVLTNPLCAVSLETGVATVDASKEWVQPLLVRHPVYAERLASALPITLSTAEREVFYWSQRSLTAGGVAERLGRSSAEIESALVRLNQAELVTTAPLTSAAVRLQRFQAGVDDTPVVSDDSLGQAWRRAVTLCGDRPFLIDAEEGSRFSYRDADTIVSAIMHRLRAEHVGPDHHVLLCAPVHVESILFFWAAVQVGAAVAVVDHLAPVGLLQEVIARVRPRLVLADSVRAPALKSPGGERLLVLDAEAETADFTSIASWLTEEDYAAGRQDPIEDASRLPAVVLFTSGSTGRPKGVVLSQHALAHSGRLMGKTYGWTPEDVYLGAGELHTMSGLRNAAVTPVTSGACALIATEEARRQPTMLLETVQRHRPTLLGLVPAALRQLAILGSRTSARELRSVRLVISTGSALPEATRQEFSERHGIPVRNYYGLTETAGLCLAEGLDAATPGSIGRPVDALLRIVDDAGTDLPLGATGELLVHSANLMTGYLNDAEATRAAFLNGWFRTGDLARVNAGGTVTLCGRKRDIVKSVHGELVAPQDVEDVLLGQPFVADAAVVGFGGGDGIERILAALTLRPGAPELPLDAIRSAIVSRLGERHLPSRFVILDRIPRSPHGKLLKEALLQAVQTHE